MSNKSDPIEDSRMRYAKEKSLKEKYIRKKKELDIKIKKCDENMKKMKEDIENLEIEKTIKAIKLKGYSLSYIQEVVQSGVLDQEQKQQNEVNNEEEKQC